MTLLKAENALFKSKGVFWFVTLTRDTKTFLSDTNFIYSMQRQSCIDQSPRQVCLSRYRTPFGASLVSDSNLLL